VDAVVAGDDLVLGVGDELQPPLRLQKAQVRAGGSLLEEHDFAGMAPEVGRVPVVLRERHRLVKGNGVALHPHAPKVVRRVGGGLSSGEGVVNRIGPI